MKTFKILCWVFFSYIIFPTTSVSESIDSSKAHFPIGERQIVIPNIQGVRADLLQYIAPIIEKSIVNGKYPGAVILASHRGKIIYQGVFGNRRIVPDIAPMQLNTIFDIASLTKIVATTPAIMQLLEQGQLMLDDPVIKYWKEFAKHNKEKITIRELLTHTSGLPSHIYVLSKNKVAILEEIASMQPLHPPGKKNMYSDVNFIILAHIVEKITGEPFDHYVRNHILIPLKMKHTFFLPPVNLKNQIAPTEIVDNQLRWGKAHDPIAYAMHGVSGNAGLFSTAQDLGQYAQCLLNKGRIIKTTNKKTKSQYLLGPLTILKMITPQTPEGISEKRGLGWDIDSPFSVRGSLFSINSFGHTGWTGTSIWIDPETATWIIFLTSKTHPQPHNDNQIVEDRRLISNIIAASLTDISIFSEKISQKNTHLSEIQRAYR